MENKLILIENAELDYLLSAPLVQNEETGKWPVLCFLHGYGEGAPTSIMSGLTAHGPLRPGSSPLVRAQFVIVAPQLPAQGDIWGIYSDAVSEIINQTYAKHNGDPERTFITGFSYGGNGVFDLALQNRKLWRALWPVDPTRVPEKDPGLPIWLSSGEASRQNSSRFIERMDLKQGGEFGERMYVDEGLDHVGTATSAYRDDRVYKWLLTR